MTDYGIKIRVNLFDHECPNIVRIITHNLETGDTEVGPWHPTWEESELEKSVKASNDKYPLIRQGLQYGRLM